MAQIHVFGSSVDAITASWFLAGVWGVALILWCVLFAVRFHRAYSQGKLTANSWTPMQFARYIASLACFWAAGVAALLSRAGKIPPILALAVVVAAAISMMAHRIP